MKFMSLSYQEYNTLLMNGNKLIIDVYLDIYVTIIFLNEDGHKIKLIIFREWNIYYNIVLL